MAWHRELIAALLLWSVGLATSLAIPLARSTAAGPRIGSAGRSYIEAHAARNARMVHQSDRSTACAGKTSAVTDDIQSLGRILRANLLVFALLVIGRWTAGLLTAAVLLYNGLTLGLLLRYAVRAGFGGVIIAGLAPHGVAEVAALLMAAAFGLQGGRRALTSTPGVDRAGASRGSASGLLAAGLTTLIAAAFVEAFATPYVIAWASR